MTDVPFKWDDTFLIGIEELDHEHRVLIDDINRLNEGLTGQGAKSEVEQCLGDIYVRMQAHFALEEHVMKEHDYEFFDEHKREHDKLLDSYTECMVQFLNAGGDSSGNPIEDCLKHWVISHIVTSDRKMSLMVQDKASFKTRLQK